MFDDQFGNENGDLAIRMFVFDLKDVLYQRTLEQSDTVRVRRPARNRSARFRYWRDYITLPHCIHLVTAVFGVHMDRFDMVAYLHGEAEALLGDAGPAVEWDNDQRLGEIVDPYRTVDSVAFSTRSIVTLDRAHEHDQCGDKDGGNPRTGRKLGYQYHHQGDASRDSSDAVDDHAIGSALGALLLPMHDHSGLRESEGQKCSDCKQGDETIGDAAEDDEQRGGEADECDIPCE